LLPDVAWHTAQSLSHPAQYRRSPLCERPRAITVKIEAKQATIVRMPFAVFAIRLLTCMFFVGLVGSTVVVLISFVEDGKELFGKDEK
jgi:hypothetical protein